MKRRGFGIITAIILLALIATVAVMILSLAAASSKKATDDYLRIQADMLARSATEFAVMRIQGFDKVANNGCLQNINIVATPFDINATISYFGNFPGCNNVLSDINDTDLKGMAQIDVVVTTQANVASEPIRIHKRTLQKP